MKTLFVLMLAACVAGAQNVPPSAFAPLGRIGMGALRVPKEYQELAYIESTGTQWIDTGLLLNIATAGVSIDCMGLASNNRMWGVSETIESIPRRISEYFTSAGIAYVSADPGVGLGHAISNRAVVAISGGAITLNGVSKGTYTAADIQFTRSFRLFGELQGVGAGTMAIGRSRVYSAELTVGAAQVRDLIPARRKADGVLGMWDAVGKSFYTNKGTGVFTAGPDVK